MTDTEARPLFLERLDGDEWHDEIRVTTVPRYKTSGLSGDEWRTSAHVQVLRKGRVVTEHSYRDVQTAAAALPWLLMTYAEDGILDTDLTRDLCMQPGCGERATVLYRKTADGCGRCGGTRELDEMFLRYRAFCGRHARRGNSDLDDMDERYELVVGVPEPQAGDERPAAFGGITTLDEVPGFLKRLRKRD